MEIEVSINQCKTRNDYISFFYMEIYVFHIRQKEIQKLGKYYYLWANINQILYKLDSIPIINRTWKEFSLPRMTKLSTVILQISNVLLSPKFLEAEDHRKATTILKKSFHPSSHQMPEDQSEIRRCKCCDRIVGQYPERKVCYKMK